MPFCRCVAACANQSNRSEVWNYFRPNERCLGTGRMILDFQFNKKHFAHFLLKFVCHQKKTPRLFFLIFQGSQRAVPCGRLLKTQNLSCANWGGKTKTRKTKKARSREVYDLSDDLKRTAKCFSPVKLHEIHGKLSRQQGWPRQLRRFSDLQGFLLESNGTHIYIYIVLYIHYIMYRHLKTKIIRECV